MKIASESLSKEWQELIEKEKIPERADGELTITEFMELSGLKRTTAERHLREKVDSGEMKVRKVKIDGRIWRVYSFVKIKSTGEGG